jgi:Zn-dependent protease
MLDPTILREAVLYLVALILSVCVHEFGHAFVADRLGDALPRSQGRVTLNPLAHIDPIGTILMPVIGVLAPGAMVLGWGKPVQISLSARAIDRRITVRTAHLLIALAGPMMNILFGLLLSGVFVALRLAAGPVPIAGAITRVVAMNIGLAFFNLIPCPPLDGGAILRGLLPRDLEFVSDFLERYGFVILLVLLVTRALRYLMYPALVATDWWLQLLNGWVS